MKVLLLGGHSEKLVKTLVSFGDSYVITDEKIFKKGVVDNDIEFIVSFGYRFIISSGLIEFMKDRIINIHISYLPWNRGADPNFWSFIDNTPKGVTIHYIDKGLDTGDIIDQVKTSFDPEKDTLQTSYEQLIDRGVMLFEQNWPFIRKGENDRTIQPKKGSFHNTKDKESLLFLIKEKNWKTPIKKLVDFNYEKK